MRAVKPIRLGMLHRTLELGQQPHIVVSVLAMTPFSGEKEVLGEIPMWKLVEAHLPGGMLDEAFSKPAGEVVVHGRFHAPGGKPVPVSFVGLELRRGDAKLVDKKLAVFGDRVWKGGAPSAPEPIATCPIDWEHAFGGPQFPMNPVGRGLKPTSSDAPWTLPNVEDPAALISSPSDRPRPASFAPMDLTSPLRQKLAGTYGGDYLKTRFPGPAADMDPRFFHTALENQRIPGFFKGGETIVVHNMHPTAARLEGRITTLSARAFLERKGRSGVVFEEVPLRMDSAIVFPEKAVIVNIFRGMVPVLEDDASDVLALVIGADDPQMPRAPKHYQDVLRARTDRERHGALFAFADEELMPQREAGWGNPRATFEAEEETKLEGLIEKRIGARREQIQREKRAELAKAGLNPDDFLPEAEPEEPPPALDDFAAIGAYVDKMLARAEEEKAKAEKRRAELDKKAREEAAKAGVDWDAEIAKAVEALAGPPKFRARTELENRKAECELARNAGLPLLELEEQIASGATPAALEEQERRLLEGYRVGAAFRAPARRLDEAASERARERIARARAAGSAPEDLDFAGADLSGQDLSGMALEGGLFEGADLSNANLNGAKLCRAVLVRAKLTGATLVGADLSDANLGDTTFDGVDLSRANLAKALVMRARLDDARFVGALLDEALLVESTFGRVDFTEALVRAVAFVQADLRGACFARATLEKVSVVECDLSGCDLEGAVLRQTVWADTKLDGARLGGASLVKCAWARGISFEKGSLREARIDTSCMRGANLKGADFTRATVAQSDLAEADLTDAVLVEANARGSLFIRTNFTRANARGASFMEAILKNAILFGADFSKANLFRAMMSRARGDDATRFTGANVEYVLRDPVYKEPPRG